MIDSQQTYRTTYTLLELTESIKSTLADRFISAYWVKAEMNKLNHYIHSGHCFPELLEKQEGKVVAQMRSTLWREDYRRVNQQFIDMLGEPLKDGVKILFLARVAFDPVYGLSLRIIDIDPAYTLGDIEREKQETIRLLQQQGLFGLNKALPPPLLPQRLAIISVETSKGLADFLEITGSNPWGYRFFHMLFPSHLQGDKAVETITTQLKRISKVRQHFDAVAIIRGGGDDIGLSCFNNYRLCHAIATYPLPVYSGIGHSTNETVAEMVTHHNAITPTKLAEFLIQQFHNYAIPLREAEEVLVTLPSRLLQQERERLQVISHRVGSNARRSLSASQQVLLSRMRQIRREVYHMVGQARYVIGQSRGRLRKGSAAMAGAAAIGVTNASLLLKNGLGRLLQQEHEILRNQEKLVDSLNPQNVLRRGYSITTAKGKVIRDHREVKHGDTLETTLYRGKITSTVESKEKIA